ncbi:MAG: B12-binding domain-containing radical SAM protein [Candidatus Poribacteria bacterium]
MIALIAGPRKPPRSVQGLGLPYLAAVLQEAGFEAKIFDLYPSSPDTDEPATLDQRLSDVIAQYHPLIVGMTIHTPAYSERVRLAKFIRERLPTALLIAGGHHPSAEPVHLLQNTDFDLCVIGEGERTLLEIARRVAQGEARGRSDWLREIRGVVYKQGEKIFCSQPRPPVSDMDSLPFPANHLLGLGDYAPHPNLGVKSTGILTYRGCPMRCAFCNNPQGHQARLRSPLRVVDEMMWVVEKFDVRGFNFYDNLFGLNRRHALAVCEEIIQRRMDVVWECWTAGDLVDSELAEKMKAAHCVRVGFGAESGDDEVLVKAQRGFTVAQHQAGIRALRVAGLKVVPFFMVGLPGESEKSVRRTVEFAMRCGADEICLSLYRPYPGTAVWNHPEAFDIRIIRGPNFEAYIETGDLSRAAMLECAQWASDKLKQRASMKSDFLRCDRYEWEMR